MKLYSFQHVLQVFILGFIGGFFGGGLLISAIKSKRVIEKEVKIRIPKRKIPSVATTEYPIVSYKNY
jgi:TctA family transporter